MAIFNVRISDDLKRRMEGLSHLNWSEIVRKAVEGRVLEEQGRRKERARILEAIRTQDRIAETLARRYKGPWKGTGVIRYWRDHRYSSSTRR